MLSLFCFRHRRLSLYADLRVIKFCENPDGIGKVINWHVDGKLRRFDGWQSTAIRRSVRWRVAMGPENTTSSSSSRV